MFMSKQNSLQLLCGLDMSLQRCDLINLVHASPCKFNADNHPRQTCVEDIGKHVLAVTKLRCYILRTSCLVPVGMTGDGTTHATLSAD